MPIIILGLIVVLGAALLIYYQLGPKVTLRLKKNRSEYGGGFGGYSEDNPQDGDFNSDGVQDDANPTHVDDGKVLFIFGDGEREERPISEDDEKDNE